MRFSHFTPRGSCFDMMLKCSNCRSERHEARGLIHYKGHFEEVWYLGCECPTPKGVVKV